MPSPSHSPRGALRARDAGLRKISVATRVLVVGSIAVAGAFASMAAWAQPGRAKAATKATGLGSLGRVSTATVPPTTPATLAPQSDGLRPPTEAPTTVAPDPGYQYTPPSYQYSPPPAVSGAS